MTASAAIEAVAASARKNRARLLAFLASRCGDIAAAEDALADAYCAALEHWPRSGIPERPEAWLLIAARRRLVDGARARAVRTAALPDLRIAAEEARQLAEGEASFPDERLRLMFACAHPLLDSRMHAPLMLQTVMGLDAAAIASCFLVKPSTMGQRLSRAKARIGSAGLRFEIPENSELPSRLTGVLEAIYAAFTVGLEAEAGELAMLIAARLPEEAEALGLAALLRHCGARRAAARRDGAYVPLAEQDTSGWSAAMIAEADDLLAAAAAKGRMGRFQLEAAMQAVHNRRAATGRTDWAVLLELYDGLVAQWPSLGARLGRVAVLAEVQGAEMAWCALEELEAAGLRDHQPYWALRAHLLHRLGRWDEAAEAYALARGLSTDPAVRQYIESRARCSRVR